MQIDLPGRHLHAPGQSGFSLVELAIVLVVVALLLGGLLVPLTMQVEQQKTRETQKILEDAKESIVGFAIANGRLPCPASTSSNGQESFAAGGDATNGKCSNFFDGFLPAVTLGINPVDANGYAVDAWALTQNRIRYAITTANSNAFTSTGGMATTTMSVLDPDLRVCASATGITATACGTATSLSNNAVAVVYSLGKNAATGGVGLDEAANLNGDAVFASHTPTPSTAANGEFDDLVTWLSPNILFNRMVAAGRLP